MERRLPRLLAAALACSLMLTACSASGFGSGSAVTIRLVAADYGDRESNSSRQYWDAVAAAFTAANPGIRVDVRVVNWNDIDKQVKEMIGSGDVPDVLQTGGYADKVAGDLLYKASDVLSIGTQANFLDSFAKAGQVEGIQYGIPFVSSARAFFYNKAIFRRAGIAEPPTTWDELRRDAQRIKEKVPGTVPYALPLGPEEAQAETLIWELGNDGGFTDRSGRYALDSPQNVETFGWLRSNLVTPGLTYPDPARTDRRTAFADFAAGKAAMLNGHPSLIKLSVAGGIDYGVVPIPGRVGPLKSTLGVADWMMAFKKWGHRKEIKTFLDFVYTGENTLRFDETYNLMPVTHDTLLEMTASGRHRDLEPFLALLPQATFYPLGDTGWDAISAEIKKSAGTAVRRPEDTLGALQRQALATGPH
ncbi:extracellular solute-binding protein [Kitasatospora sp. DSM 101779]|uniref:extracellular solute-binding protein n=1 Tax=Kitasatospora sp. DSM 101779 TaxID=2853165 RepID=UPI0021D91C7F|nr:extracellular solute-binding protein [Kitasatospora sp. DSM 101779]MCU7826313.1 extracellular solute-binding protein [Kitasatospora sp. DSM 101779]